MPNSSWVAPKDRGKVIPGGTAENPLKARWLGIYAGAGIHGTDDSGSIGSAASHGCIRMRIPDVIDLYDRGAGQRAGVHLVAPARISSTGTSSHPFSIREAWCSEWRMHRAPMYLSRTGFRITAYHMVIASRVPWIGNQGGGGAPRWTTPASSSWRRVAI